MSRFYSVYICLTALCALFICAAPFQAQASEDIESILSDGEFFGEMRWRLETVEQDGVVSDAEASTIRTNIGFKTGKYRDFQGVFEAQLVRNIGPDNFNDTVNGQTNHPVVADPDAEEINQAFIAWTGLPDTTLRIGRRGINIANQRFIGTVAWRQNDQTFDGAGIEYAGVENLTLAYDHVINVNRIFGDDHPLGDLDSNTHLLRADYKVADWLKLHGYGYWMEFDEAQALSNKTFGIRAAGKAPVTENLKWSYEAEYATQSDHGNRITSYDENYYHIASNIHWSGLTLGAGYEVLEGDGTSAFQTPLATGHKFNGWADKFLGTPADGLEDFYLKAGYKVSGVHDWVDGVKFTAVYHDFEAENSSRDFGNEWNLSLSKNFKGPDFINNINVTLKYADYNGDDPAYRDTEKTWIQFGIKF